MTRYANDVIATCAFGIKVDSQAERENEFYAMGKCVATFGFKRILIFVGYTSLPSLMKVRISNEHCQKTLYSQK